MAPSKSRRAVGVVRVSRVGERNGERFVSPSEQRERIEDACARDAIELIDVARSSTSAAALRSIVVQGSLA